MDAWWPRSHAAMKEDLNPNSIAVCGSSPLTILAVDAPMMGQSGAYGKQAMSMLAKKVFLIFYTAEALRSPLILSGLLGGGAFRGNRPLVLLLHMLIQPQSAACNLRFHHPIFWSFCDQTTDVLETRVVAKAEAMLDQLRKKGVQTLGEAIDELLAWRLPLSHNDVDLENDRDLQENSANLMQSRTQNRWTRNGSSTSQVVATPDNALSALYAAYEEKGPACASSNPPEPNNEWPPLVGENRSKQSNADTKVESSAG